MKNNRLNQLLFALILSLGILFGHTNLVLADGEPADEGAAETNNDASNDETPDAVPATVLEPAQYTGEIDPQTIIQQGEAYLENGFNEYIDESNDTPTVVETEGALLEAGAAEGAEIIVAQPIDEEYKEPIVQSESDAIGLTNDANGNLANAVAEGVKAEVEIAKEGVEITTDVIGAGVNLIQAEIAAGQAADAKEEAQQNLNDALEANTREEAQAAADRAQENANTAQAAAEVALAQATEAANKAIAAGEAYVRAEEEYNNAKAKIQAELAAGLISLEQAEIRTAAAEETAKNYYEKMIAAQAEAEAFTQTAKEASEAADAALVASVEELARIVAENAKNVAGKTAITVGTGAAYEAAIIAENFAKQPVDTLNESIDEVQGRIKAIDALIEKAQEEYIAAAARVENIENTDEYITAFA